jgi:galactoside O-acetyltransferase
MEGYYSKTELDNIGFKKIGINNKISKKCTFIKINNISIGNNCRIDDNCIFSASSKGIDIGNFVHISNNVCISGNAYIKIENFCGLSSKVTIFGSSDDYTGKYMTNPCVGEFNDNCTNITSKDIIIGEHSIIGCNSVILPGCSINSGISVGALSLVNKPLIKHGIYHGIHHAIYRTVYIMPISWYIPC